MPFQRGFTQCPDYISCDGTGLIFVYNYSIDQATLDEFLSGWFGLDFGEGSPFNHDKWRNASITVSNSGSFSHVRLQNIFLDIPFIPCDVYPAVTLTLPSGEVCNYEYNTYCPECPYSEEANPQCEEWIDICEDMLYSAIVRNLEIKGCEQWRGECGPYEEAYRLGGVGIGVTSEPPAGTWTDWYAYKLFVRGGILTEQFKLANPISYPDWGNNNKEGDAQEWCDYVFKEGYPLASLPEVEAYIRKNKRLPNTPSTAEIEAQGGFDLREVVLNHQEKIEEVFLHLIDLQKQAEVLQARLQEAKKENELLKDEL